ncbi:peptidylprolyl isomerase [Desulfurispirillum indicum]|uniref:peptidylprolyl isomerase n=1 Tax=Desulfurispirillum indicum TaxID=936456 RepID=UPI001CF9C9BC|nr:peptidylprolyl isomerase [Desulfurispirillum indicum]UCZ57076.1 peptidylprolyl isomerase [Desulfurispirillum indicum]
MKKIGFSLFIVLCGAALSAATLVDGIAAVVNGVPITIQEVRQANKEHIERATRGLADEQAREATRQMLLEGTHQKVEQMLLEDYGRRNRIFISAQQVEEAINQVAANNNVSRSALESMLADEGISMESYRRDIRVQLLVMQIGQKLSQEISVSELEVVSAFREGRFQRIPYADVGHVLIALDGKSDDQAIRIAERLHERIISGDIEFEEAARQYSEGPNAAEGGLMKDVRRGRLLRELDQAIFSMEKGQTTLVRSSVGYHILHLYDLGFNREMSDEDFSRTRAALLREKQERRLQGLMDELRDSAVIQYNLKENS